jgi:hypothetical protein
MRSDLVLTLLSILSNRLADCELEWETAQNFIDFFTGEAFKTFAASAIVPLATAPAKPEVYETNHSPAEVNSSSVTEVFRIRYDDEADLRFGKVAWAEFVAAVQANGPGVPALDGESVNWRRRCILAWLDGVALMYVRRRKRVSC